MRGLVISVPTSLDLRFPVPFELPRGTGLYWSRQFRRWGSMDSWKDISDAIDTDFLIKIWASSFLSVLSWASYIIFFPSVSSAARLNAYAPGGETIMWLPKRLWWWLTANISCGILIPKFSEKPIAKLPDTTLLCIVGILKPNRE